MKRDILILSALCTCCNLFAEEITVKYLRYAGPYEIKGPFIVDSLDVNSKKFTDAELLKTAIPFNNVRKSNRTLDAATTAGQSKNSSVSLASFYLNSDRYTDGTLQISGPEHYEVYIDNEKQTPANGELKLTLEPRRYEVVIKISYSPGRNEPHSESHLQDGQQSRCHGDNRSREALHFERCLRWHTHSFRQPLPQRQIPVDRLPDDLSRWRYRILPASDRPGHRAGFNGKQQPSL